MDREASFVKAIKDFETGVFKHVCATVKENGVNHMIVRCRQNRVTTCHKAHTIQQALKEGEELALINLIQHSDWQGFPIRHATLKAIAEYLIQKRCGDLRR